MAERRPQICKSCGKLMGIADTCPYCGARRNSPVGFIRGFLRWASGPDGLSVTRTIMMFCGFIFIFSLLITLLFAGPQALVGAIFRPSGLVLQLLGANSPRVFTGVWWTPITSVFLHIGVIHLAFNLYALSIIGPMVESTLGRSSFWLIFILSGSFGALLSAFQGHSAAGASGAVMGLIGAGITTVYLSGRGMDDPMLRTLALWALITFAFGIFSGMNIDNWGHFGGFAAGGALSTIWFQFRRTPGFSKFTWVGAMVALVMVPIAYIAHIFWLF